MKTILWVSAAILAIIIGNLGINWYLDRTAAELSQQIAEVQQLVRTNQWAEAISSFEQTDGHWKQVRSTWAALIRHQEIDELEKTFGRVTQFIASEDRNMSLAELETAKLLIEHIPDKEKITISNIL